MFSVRHHLMALRKDRQVCCVWRRRARARLDYFRRRHSLFRTGACLEEASNNLHASVLKELSPSTIRVNYQCGPDRPKVGHWDGMAIHLGKSYWRRRMHFQLVWSREELKRCSGFTPWSARRDHLLSGLRDQMGC